MYCMFACYQGIVGQLTAAEATPDKVDQDTNGAQDVSTPARNLRSRKKQASTNEQAAATTAITDQVADVSAVFLIAFHAFVDPHINTVRVLVQLAGLYQRQGLFARLRCDQTQYDRFQRMKRCCVSDFVDSASRTFLACTKDRILT